MRYPCAYEGVGKIGKAAIITIAVTVIGIITDLIGILAADSLDQLNQLGGGISPVAVAISILAVPMAIMGLVGMVIRILGVRKASQEEPEFNLAFWMILIQIIISVINGLIADDCRGAKLFVEVASDFLGLLAAIFIIKGIKSLADHLENSEVGGGAALVRNAFVIAYVIGIAGRIVSYIAFKSDNFYLVTGVEGLISGIIILAVYLYYIKFLKKAEAMLGYDLYMTSDEVQ